MKCLFHRFADPLKVVPYFFVAQHNRNSMRQGLGAAECWPCSPCNYSSIKNERSKFELIITRPFPPRDVPSALAFTIYNQPGNGCFANLAAFMGFKLGDLSDIAHSTSKPLFSIPYLRIAGSHRPPASDLECLPLANSTTCARARVFVSYLCVVSCACTSLYHMPYLSERSSASVLGEADGRTCGCKFHGPQP